MERSKGVKEQIKGFIKRDPELKKTGKERRTGELKRREKEQVQSFSIALPSFIKITAGEGGKFGSFPECQGR